MNAVLAQVTVMPMLCAPTLQAALSARVTVVTQEMESPATVLIAIATQYS
jgi:hypothetical protein